MAIDDIMRQAFVLVRVTELELSLGSQDNALLRVETLESRSNPGTFKARIWRLEHFRIQSSFPQQLGIPMSEHSDERIWKEFDGFSCPLETARGFPSAVAAEEYVLNALSRWLEDQLGL
jgi:hypothetical protein